MVKIYFDQVAKMAVWLYTEQPQHLIYPFSETIVYYIICSKGQDLVISRTYYHLRGRGIDFTSLSTIFQLNFGTVPTVWYLFLFYILLREIINL